MRIQVLWVVTLCGWLCVSDIVKEHGDVIYKCGQSEEWEALCSFETMVQTNLMAASHSSRPEPSTALL
jgi:hypothetical protein